MHEELGEYIYSACYPRQDKREPPELDAYDPFRRTSLSSVIQSTDHFTWTYGLKDEIKNTYWFIEVSKRISNVKFNSGSSSKPPNVPLKAENLNLRI